MKLDDFNYPHIELENMYSSHDVKIKFLDIINDCALEWPVTDKTKRIVI